MNATGPRVLLASIAAVAAVAGALSVEGRAQGGGAVRNQHEARAGMTQVLGRPTDRSIVLSVLSPVDVEVSAEYGATPGSYDAKTPAALARAGEPLEILLEPLRPDTSYRYRVHERRPGGAEFRSGPERPFHTQRAPGRAFTFAVQGDSHPERLNRMFDPALYRRTLENVQKDQPDFHVTLGDDFSIERLIARGELTQRNVDQVYADQRQYLGAVASSAPLFLVNGNHEEAARYLMKGTEATAPLLAGRARARFFPLPGPDAFYSGDAETVEGIGLLRDYYAWTWGDALFVVIDPYWHSPVQVDAAPGGGGGRRSAGAGDVGVRPQARGPQGREAGGRARDWWGITIGDAQYRWLKNTLESSHARFKFVFAHHVLGTGRGGVEMADLYEWGGNDRNGTSQFSTKRPGWELPIHQLMARAGVTVFFQGHDHLFARQQRDGIVYQEVPNPADASYQAFNRDAYRSGDILPNSGHVRVTVTPAQVKVDYVRAWLPSDETGERRNGEVAFSYVLDSRARP